MAPDKPVDAMRATLVAIAPGTGLRDGLERILRAQTGALVVLGDNAVVQQVSSSGFGIGEDFSPQRLSELAKMDGAIVVSPGAAKIVRANVHLVPDPSIPTMESGTRHRTAERVARQTGFPVVAVSQSMHIVTVYMDSVKWVLEDVTALLTRANQALQTLKRYKQRLTEVASNLLALEAEDLLDPSVIARVLGHPVAPEALDVPSSPRGYRILSKIPRLPTTVVDRIVSAFGRLPKVMAASTEDLLAVEGVGAARASSVKD